MRYNWEVIWTFMMQYNSTWLNPNLTFVELAYAVCMQWEMEMWDEIVDCCCIEKKILILCWIEGAYKLTPLSILFQSYRGGQLYWQRKPETITNMSQVTDKRCYIMLYQVHLTMIGFRTYNVSGDWHTDYIIQLPHEHDGHCIKYTNDHSLK